MNPAQAAAERVQAYLDAREHGVERAWLTPDEVAACDDATLTASDLRALIVAAWGAEAE